MLDAVYGFSQAPAVLPRLRCDVDGRDRLVGQRATLGRHRQPGPSTPMGARPETEMRAPVGHDRAQLFSPRAAVRERRRATGEHSARRRCSSSYGNYGRPTTRCEPRLREGMARSATAGAGLRVTALHCPGFDASPPPSRRCGATRWRAWHPPISVLIDADLQLWQEYGNQGWPGAICSTQARLFDYPSARGIRRDEPAIQELVGVEREPLPQLRPEDARDARLRPQNRDQRVPTGPPTRRGVWVCLDGAERSTVNGGSARAAETCGRSTGRVQLLEHEQTLGRDSDRESGRAPELLANCLHAGVG